MRFFAAVTLFALAGSALSVPIPSFDQDSAHVNGLRNRDFNETLNNVGVLRPDDLLADAVALFEALKCQSAFINFWWFVFFWVNVTVNKYADLISRGELKAKSTSSNAAFTS